MSAEIVNSGRSYITDKLAGNLPTTINRFILANVPHSDPNTPVDLDEPMPSSEQVVYDESITRSAKINVDEVVFSQILLSDVGDFDFNWIGLATDDNTLIAVVYVPLQHKRKYVGNQIGNSITRNVVLKFAQAADALGVTIAPETWQFDMLDVIQAEIQKAIEGHDHDNEYYRKQHIDETFATKQEALANSQPNFIKTQDDEITLNKLNFFKIIKTIVLPTPEEDCFFNARVEVPVSKNGSKQPFQAPDGKQITVDSTGERDTEVNIVTPYVEYTFKFINGEWSV
jgi:hypothetical protein